jgi:hypothetical protein
VCDGFRDTDGYERTSEYGRSCSNRITVGNSIVGPDRIPYDDRDCGEYGLGDILGDTNGVRNGTGITDPFALSNIFWHSEHNGVVDGIRECAANGVDDNDWHIGESDDHVDIDSDTNTTSSCHGGWDGVGLWNGFGHGYR